MYDVIGDIHGHADALVALLSKLGYESRGAYAHPDGRRALFLGDFIDRGPQIKRVLEIVRAMTQSGSAHAILGNHEFNALCYATEFPPGSDRFLRPHTDANRAQHRETLSQLSEAERAEYLAWFRTLPGWFDRDGIRAVHACWDEGALQTYRDALTRLGRMTPEFLATASDPTSAVFRDVEITLKGKEARLPAGYSFRDNDGHERTAVRTRWYAPPAGHTYRTYALQTDPPEFDEPLTAEVVAATRPYPEDAPPLFVGHYWLSAARPVRLARNVACLDYSVAKGGFLCAYRWNGEAQLDPEGFVTSAD